MQCVIVCVDYADFLKWTLPSIVHQFDKTVVVTEERDIDTINLCKFYDVQYLTVAGNKGIKINAGLNCLDKTKWVAQIDADIYLPPQTINIIRHKQLDKQTLYGIDRCMCQSYDQFIKFLDGKQQVYSEKFFTVPPFPIGARLSQHYGKGYLPIGYFQLWHPLGSGVFNYPTDHEDEGMYARTDVKHIYKFDKTELISEVLAIHLESEVSTMGANWNGRVTTVFGNFTVANVKKQDDIYIN